MNTPKPSAKFLLAQQKYARILSADEPRTTDRSVRRKMLYNQLESEFMEAWKLALDQQGRAAKMQYKLAPGLKHNDIGLDHCSYYYDPARARFAIVTQPYGEFVEQLRAALRIGICSPEVIHAPEWSFYYPGKAQLHLIFFPEEYPSALSTNSSIREEHGFN